VHMARRRASGGTDATDDLSPRHLIADLDLDLGHVVVGGREAVAVPIRVTDHDSVAVAAGPPRVNDRPVEGCPDGVSARLPEVDAVVPALPVGERVGTVPEAGGRGVVGDRPADEVAAGCNGGSGRDHAHRVGDEVAVLDQSCDEGRRPHWCSGEAHQRGTVRAAGLGSDGLRQGDVGQRAPDEGHSEDQCDASAEPASVVAPGGVEGMSGLKSVLGNDRMARGDHVPGAQCVPEAASARHNGHERPPLR